MAMKVVHLDGDFDNPTRDFRIEDEVLQGVGEKIFAPPSDVWHHAAIAEVVLVRAAVVDADKMALLKNCHTLIRYGVGVDKIDCAAATAQGIAVCNVPDFCTSEMADHTLMLALALIRRLPFYQARARKGVWALDSTRPVHDLSSLRWIAVGFGRIAREVLQRARAFGFQTGATDPLVTNETIAQTGATPYSLKQAIQEADLLSLHCPLLPETRGLLREQTFAQMKPGAFLVNTARGGLIDTPALTNALRHGHLGGAALDTTEPEPLPEGHPLYTMPHVIITPHMAWHSCEAEQRLRRKVAEEAVRALRGEPLQHKLT